MKKIIFSIAIVLTLGMTANAQGRDAFFRSNDTYFDINRDNIGFTLPTGHGFEDDANVPIDNGLLVLTVLGAGYAVYRKKTCNGASL